VDQWRTSPDDERFVGYRTGTWRCYSLQPTLSEMSGRFVYGIMNI
jgi:hypothetical protein